MTSARTGQQCCFAQKIEPSSAEGAHPCLYVETFQILHLKHMVASVLSMYGTMTACSDLGDFCIRQKV